jgi:hypothetical protein
MSLVKDLTEDSLIILIKFFWFIDELKTSIYF